MIGITPGALPALRMTLPQPAVSAMARAVRACDSVVLLGVVEMHWNTSQSTTSNTGGAALLPPGAARRTLAERRTAVAGGATSLHPKPAVVICIYLFLP